MPIAQLVRSSLRRTPIRAPLLALRNRILRPEWWLIERRFDSLIGPLVRGKLVFDVGANHGGYIARLLRCKAGRIIAMEPQPALSEKLRQRFPAHPGITFVDKAVGGTIGTIPMNICEGDQVSSCRPDWKEVFPEQKWTTSVDVPVTTLDLLMTEFGRPAFCKVDVEGFEPEVLAGLSKPIPVMSLEFTPKVPHITRAVIRRLGELGYRRMNYALHDRFTFALPKDVSPAEAETALTDKLPESHRGGGDIYAFAE